MHYRKVINTEHADSAGGSRVAASINAVIAVNLNEEGRSFHSSSKQSVKIIQRRGRTEVYETTVETKGEDDDGPPA